MYNIPINLDQKKIFLVNRSEIEGRLDPKMALFNRKVHHSLYPRFKIKDLLLSKPQYGAGESGIIRSSFVKSKKAEEAQNLLDGIDIYLLQELCVSLPVLNTDLLSRMFFINRFSYRMALCKRKVLFLNNTRRLET